MRSNVIQAARGLSRVNAADERGLTLGRRYKQQAAHYRDVFQKGNELSHEDWSTCRSKPKCVPDERRRYQERD
jgi:hypothetical protein